MSINTKTNPLITFSTSRTEMITGHHEFKIMGYSLNKGLGLGNYIESKAFEAGGYGWTIRFYPDGMYPSNSHVSMVIVLASDGTDVRATFDLALVDHSGGKQHKEFKCGAPCLFRSRGSLLGDNRVIKKSLLDNSVYIKDDCLLILARVGVVRSITEEPKICSVTVPPSNISQQIGKLLESGEGSDIRFKVGGEFFAAHKFVLTLRSPVLKAQLAGPMNDSNNVVECVEIVDMEAAVFKALLHFIYWDALLDLECLFAQHLLEAADRYGLERLRLICEAKLCDGVAIDNVATTLALAEQHHCSQLKSICLQFIAQPQNMQAVMKTKDFRHLRQSCPTVINELGRLLGRAWFMGHN